MQRGAAPIPVLLPFNTLRLNTTSGNDMTLLLTYAYHTFRFQIILQSLIELNLLKTL